MCVFCVSLRLSYHIYVAHDDVDNAVQYDTTADTIEDCFYIFFKNTNKYEVLMRAVSFVLFNGSEPGSVRG